MKTQLGHYDIVSELGRGGMGVVYKGYEASLNRYVAIKVLADSLAHDMSVKERFLREARSMAALNDTHIIQIYFIGDDEGQTYFVMEFVDGESLGSVLKREGKLKPEQAAKIVFQTAQGLSTAHERGVIHRDIKPGNLMLSSRGMVKIADFGIALTTQDFSKKLTSTGEFVGTPGYLSPEVCLGNPIDQRSDIFSLGIVLFECLAGRVPFTDASPLGLMLEVVKAEIPDVCTLNSEVDAELSRILRRMIAKDPADRYQSCQELVADLQQHPLVARGGPVTLQTKMTAAAATVIGQKTPVSGQRPLLTTPTPQPVPRTATPTPAAAAGSAARTEAELEPAHRSVLDRAAPPPRRSPALPLAIAALLVLALAGAAWAFRDQIPMFKQLMPAQTASTPASTPVSVPATAPATMPSMPPAPTAPSVPAAPPPPPPAAPDIATSAGAGAGAPANATAGASVADLLGSSTPAGADGPVAASRPASNAAASDGPTGSTAASSAGPAPRASQVEPLRDLPAAQAAQASSAKRVATVSPPPPVSAPPKPHVPTIAVIAGGDIAVSEPVERAIEEALAHHGYHLVDQSMMPRVAQMLHGPRANVGAILEQLAQHRSNVDAVVIVHVRPVGEQQITFYGQSDTLKTAQLDITAYAVEGRRKLGAGWSDNVNFTAMSARDKAREAVEPMLGEIEERLSEFRPGRKG
jgi:predicted Ser/Thr protein kinase